METIEKKPASAAVYLLSGVAVGTALGVLFAPRAGSETRKELAEWGRRNREKGREFISKAGSYGKSKIGSSYAEEEDGAAHEGRKGVNEPFVS